ncbi:unnamed protein product [Agarophyton chilense]
MMLREAILARQDAVLQGQLQKLGRTNAVAVSNEGQASSHFRVHGWRWHHLGIIRDLMRLERKAVKKRGALCQVRRTDESRALRRQMHDALQYIIHDNWALHNVVEHKLFLPWIMSRDGDETNGEAVNVIGSERRRLQRHAQMLDERMAKWSECNTHNVVRMSQEQCESELQVMISNVQRLRRNASLLFEVSEQVLVPRVKLCFSEADQLRFNSTVLKHISGRQARVSLVIFRDALDLKKQPVVARSDDVHNFERDVPAPIRRVGVPFWRKRFVGDRTRFLTDE